MEKVGASLPNPILKTGNQGIDLVALGAERRDDRRLVVRSFASTNVTGYDFLVHLLHEAGETDIHGTAFSAAASAASRVE